MCLYALLLISCFDTMAIDFGLQHEWPIHSELVTITKPHLRLKGRRRVICG